MNPAPPLASSLSTSVGPKQLYAESKQKLAQRIQQNINALGSVCREIKKGSKSEEILQESAKNLVQLESTVETTAQNVEKLSAFATHLGFQFESIQTSVDRSGSTLELADSLLKQISENKADGWEETAKAALALGYHRVAVETYLEENEISFPGGRKLGAKRVKGDNVERPTDIPPPCTERTSTDGFNNEKILSRLTFAMSDPLTAYKLSQSRNAKKYDIIAIRPTSVNGFQSACQTQDCDIIQLRFPLEFRLQRKMVLTAFRRSVALEFLYSPMLTDDNLRRRTISTAHELFTISKSKFLIVSSGAKGIMDLRGPLDVCNLCELLGVEEQLARKCIMANSRSVILKALGRRTVVGVALARPVPPADESTADGVEDKVADGQVAAMISKPNENQNGAEEDFETEENPPKRPKLEEKVEEKSIDETPIYTVSAKL